MSKLEAQLYQDSQQFSQTHKEALLDHRAPATLQLNLASQEMVLLLKSVEK